MDELLKLINVFLKCEMFDEWIVVVIKKENLDVVLIDYFICELKVV